MENNSAGTKDYSAGMEEILTRGWNFIFRRRHGRQSPLCATFVLNSRVPERCGNHAIGGGNPPLGGKKIRHRGWEIIPLG